MESGASAEQQTKPLSFKALETWGYEALRPSAFLITWASDTAGNAL